MRGVTNEEKRRAIFDKHRFNADILVLQETHSEPQCEKVWEAEWGGKAIFSHGTTASKGVAVFMSKTLYKGVTEIYKDTEGRTLIFNLEDNNQVMTIAVIYAPNTDSPDFYQSLRKVLKDRKEHKIIIGDFNLTLDVDLDRLNTFCNNNKSKQEVEDIMEEYYLRDIWRIHNQNKREYSWRKKGSYPTKASRIDFALVSGGLDQLVELTQYITSIKTDHRAFYMTINTQQFERGTGYWKLNNSLLQESEYVQKINEELDACIKSTREKTPEQKWETIKKRIKTASIKYSRNKSQQDKIVISQLSEIVDEYESRLPLPEYENQLLESTKEELEDKTMERIKGVMFRSKAKWYEQGEKNTKYFFSLEKAKYNAKTCYKLLDKEKEIIKPTEIIQHQRQFYKDLYEEDTDVKFNLKNTYNIQVPEEIKQQQDTQLTIQDLQQAIKGMSNNKTPGEDGLPADFYKVFWTKIKEPFYEMAMSAYDNNILHSTARKGILNLIPKTWEGHKIDQEPKTNYTTEH